MYRGSIVSRPSALGLRPPCLSPQPSKILLTPLQMLFVNLSSTSIAELIFHFSSSILHAIFVCANFGFQEPSTIDVICNFPIKHPTPEYNLNTVARGCLSPFTAEVNRIFFPPTAENICNYFKNAHVLFSMGKSVPW